MLLLAHFSGDSIVIADLDTRNDILYSGFGDYSGLVGYSFLWGFTGEKYIFSLLTKWEGKKIYSLDSEDFSLSDSEIFFKAKAGFRF
ncbi:MAG: hypothetical protein ACOCYO_11495 [Bacteroidota bacterium]